MTVPFRFRFLSYVTGCDDAPHLVKMTTPRGVCLCLGRWQLRLERRQ